jgi:biotin synthase-related radical SAM superfamily protein
MSTCEGCGARATDLQVWTRRHGALLCPACDAAIAHRSRQVRLHLTRAEQSWDKLWQRIEDTLGRSA